MKYCTRALVWLRRNLVRLGIVLLLIVHGALLIWPGPRLSNVRASRPIGMGEKTSLPEIYQRGRTRLWSKKWSKFLEETSP